MLLTLDFTHYYGKHKRKPTTVRQEKVRYDNRLCVRLSQDTWNEINEFMEDSGLTLTQAVETMLTDSYLDFKTSKQQYEISDI